MAAVLAKARLALTVALGLVLLQPLAVTAVITLLVLVAALAQLLLALVV